MVLDDQCLTECLGLSLTIPNYSNIERKRKGLRVQLPTKSRGGINIVFDSSGLTVVGRHRESGQSEIPDGVRIEPGGKSIWAKS
jgi:Transposase DDE domain